jgi:hypothetical protein
VTLIVALLTPPALAEYITVHGGPTWSPGPGGTAISGIDVTGINNNGTAVGSAYKYDSSGASLGLRAVRFDGSGAAAVELGNLGTDIGGYTQSQAAAINNAGSVVGSSRLYLFGTFDIGDRAVRWDASNIDASSLDQLSTASTTSTVRFFSNAFAINDTGTAVGVAYKVLREGGSSSDYKGTRAVRWNASGTAVTELGHLGTDSSGLTYAVAYAINNAGIAVGNANKYSGSGADLGYRAVRWSASGTAATELGHLGTDPNGSAYCDAEAINDAGIAVGAASKYDSSGNYIGIRAVRWTTGGTAATELGHLGTDLSGGTAASASAINSSGTAIGSASKFDSSGTDLGQRAVRWDASGTAATELGNLPSFTSTSASDINDAGITVGWLDKYDGGVLLEAKAVYWGFDALPVDLNSLIDPASGWTLTHATRISESGWIGGRGTFDPDGPGGLAPYDRLYVMQVPAAAVSEPSTGVLIGIGLLNIARPSRRRARRHAMKVMENLEDRRLLNFSPTSPPEDLNAHVVWAPPPPLLADFTSDGILDKITSNSHEVLVRPGLGNGTFGDPIRTSIQPTPGAPLLAVADFSGDSRPDVLTAAAIDFESPPTANVLLGRGDGSFVLAETFSVGTGPTMLATGQIFGTGRTDVAIAGYDYLSGEQGVVAFFNDGVWWTPPPIIRTYVGPSGGNWSSAGNWSPGGVPSAGDFVEISGISVNLSASVTVADLALTGGAELTISQNGSRAFRTSGLTISQGSQLDLNDNALILDYTRPSPSSAIRDYLVSGRNGGAWNGPGLASGSAAATPRAALGYADNASFPIPRASFAGQSVDSTSILIKSTYLGDADLDGDADGVDIGIWATHFTGELGGTGSKVWVQGDWDYDGDADGVDAGLWAAAFTGELGGAGLGSITPRTPMRMGQRRLVNQFANELLVAG